MDVQIYQRQKRLKKFFWILVGILVIGGGIFGGWWFLATRSAIPESEIISRQGIHWHATLKIKILGESIDIPAGVGLENLPHKPMHTHNRDNVIHLEFPGTVRKDNLRLDQFFKIWGKEFNKNCIFDKCSGPEGQLKMLVNSQPNSEFENYIMRDGDEIEIIFE